jgi:hypothetical protein
MASDVNPTYIQMIIGLLCQVLYKFQNDLSFYIYYFSLLNPKILIFPLMVKYSLLHDHNSLIASNSPHESL